MKKKLKAILARWPVIAVVLLLLVEMVILGNTLVTINRSFENIDRNLSTIETQIAPGSEIDTTLSSIETQLAPPVP